MTEKEELEFGDMLCQLNSFCTQIGARNVLVGFREYFPAMFTELVVQANRLQNGEKTPKLLDKYAGTM